MRLSKGMSINYPKNKRYGSNNVDLEAANQSMRVSIIMNGSEHNQATMGDIVNV